MSDGVARRSGIDSDTVRGLLLINGGGAVALLAFLSSIMKDPDLSSLARAIVWAIFLFQIGLVCTVIHNRLRRSCSLEYAKKPKNRKKCRFLGRDLREPCICHLSIAFVRLSIASFLAAGIFVLVAALDVIGRAPTAETASPVEQSTTTLPPNNSFKPMPLRGTA